MGKPFNFNNIGRKIKNFTKWYCWVTIILQYIGALFCIAFSFTDDDLLEVLLPIGLGLAIVMPFITWISSWVMYAFGELVDSNMEIREQNRVIIQTTAQNMSNSNNSSANLTEELPEL